MEYTNKPKVAVIGGGIAGLTCMRHLTGIADVIGFEYNSELGGLWAQNKLSISDKDVHADSYYKLYGNVMGSMYDGLITNLPKLLHELKDYPFE